MSCLQALLHAVVQRQGVSPGGSNSLLDLDTLELAVALEAAAETEGGGCGGCDGSLSPGRGLLVVEGRAIVTSRAWVVTVMVLKIFSKHQTSKHDINPDLMTKLSTHPGLIMQSSESSEHN